MKLDQMDLVFQSLAHPARRRILDLVQQAPGCSVNALCRHFKTSRIAVMKHLKLLEAAQLIVSQKAGRTRQLYFNVVPIQMIYDRWTTEYSSFWASKVADLKEKIEAKSRRSRAAPRTGKKRKSSASRLKNKP